MGRRRIPTGNRDEDVVQPLFKEAEDRVLGYLRRLYNGAVVDARQERTYYDFRVGPWSFDVKCDQYASTTGRVAWEEFVFLSHGESDIQKLDGWGRETRLDYLCYVFPKADDVSWPCLIVRRYVMARSIAAAIDTSEQRELKAFMKEAGNRTATGYAVNIQWLRTKGCIVWETEV